MNYEEFKQEVVDRIQDFLPEKYADADVSIQTVVKNNDQKLDGLMVKLEESNICPNIYLNQFYEQYDNGRDLNDILQNIAEIRTQHEMSEDFDVNRITDFDSVKDRITCRLINAEQNAEYLADKPHTMVEDLAVTYHIAINNDEMGSMSAPVTNKLLESYGVDVETLHKHAMDNMENLTPPTFKSMTETMVEMMLPDMMQSGMSEEEARGTIAAMLPPAQDEMMYVLSNANKLNGAAVVLNDRMMDQITEKLGGEFFILPSSVHELLVVPKTEQTDLKTLENMVQEVNATQVSPGERLSDHVYAYDADSQELFRADKAEERAAAKENGRDEMRSPDKAAERNEKQDRPSLKERLAEKKDEVAKTAMSKEPPVLNKKRETALA